MPCCALARVRPRLAPDRHICGPPLFLAVSRGDPCLASSGRVNTPCAGGRAGVGALVLGEMSTQVVLRRLGAGFHREHARESGWSHRRLSCGRSIASAAIGSGRQGMEAASHPCRCFPASLPPWPPRTRRLPLLGAIRSRGTARKRVSSVQAERSYFARAAATASRRSLLSAGRLAIRQPPESVAGCRDRASHRGCAPAILKAWMLPPDRISEAVAQGSRKRTWRLSSQSTAGISLGSCLRPVRRWLDLSQKLQLAGPDPEPPCLAIRCSCVES
jgi:hypothetical protein